MLRTESTGKNLSSNRMCSTPGGITDAISRRRGVSVAMRSDPPLERLNPSSNLHFSDTRGCLRLRPVSLLVVLLELCRHLAGNALAQRCVHHRAVILAGKDFYDSVAAP